MKGSKGRSSRRRCRALCRLPGAVAAARRLALRPLTCLLSAAGGGGGSKGGGASGKGGGAGGKGGGSGGKHTPMTQDAASRIQVRSLPSLRHSSSLLLHATAEASCTHPASPPLQSAEARAHDGNVEKGSFASRAQASAGSLRKPVHLRIAVRCVQTQLSLAAAGCRALRTRPPTSPRQLAPRATVTLSDGAGAALEHRTSTSPVLLDHRTDGSTHA